MAQPANQKEITVGGIRITFLPDGYGRIDKIAMFPETTPDGWNLHPEWLDENGRVVASLGGFLIRNRSPGWLSYAAGCQTCSLTVEGGSREGAGWLRSAASHASIT
jgi:hypothetical protein